MHALSLFFPFCLCLLSYHGYVLSLCVWRFLFFIFFSIMAPLVQSDSPATQKKNNIPHSLLFIRSNLATAERLLYIRIQSIVDELTQIGSFISEFERLWLQHSKVLDQIDMIINSLRSRERAQISLQKIRVVTKYLNGMQSYSSSQGTKNIILYKKLIESTLVAILREISHLEDVSANPRSFL